MQVLSSVSELLSWREQAKPHRVLAIIGPPGSGKSTLAAEMSENLSIPHVVIPMDGFHYPQAKLFSLGLRDRMGAPDTFDTDSLAAKLTLVKMGSPTVLFPTFDRHIEEPIEDSIPVGPAHEVVILEGNYLLLSDERWHPVGDHLDLCVYVDIPEAVRLSRLVKRHVDHGKSLEDATAWVERVDNANAAVIARSATRAHAIYRPA